MFGATVVKAGGGEVLLLVDRDAESYPEVNDHVWVQTGGPVGRSSQCQCRRCREMFEAGIAAERMRASAESTRGRIRAAVRRSVASMRRGL